MTGRRQKIEIYQIDGRTALSSCGRYRYELERAWSPRASRVLWLMLNPSTADARVNDATIRRCIGFSRSWGYAGLLVGNLYGWRSTDPRELDRQHLAGVDVIGPGNRQHIDFMLQRAELVVCAWGQLGPTTAARIEVLAAIRRHGKRAWMLRLNRNQQPAHPLRLPASLRPQEWAVFGDDGNGVGA